MEQEQKEDLKKITEESLEFLKNVAEREWAAYPESELPYPKEKIKEAFKFSLKTSNDEPSVIANVSKMTIKWAYHFLGNFVSDDEAALVNSMALRYNKDFKLTESMKTIELPDKLKGTEYPTKNILIAKKINEETLALMKEMETY